MPLTQNPHNPTTIHLTPCPYHTNTMPSPNTMHLPPCPYLTPCPYDLCCVPGNTPSKGPYRPAAPVPRCVSGNMPSRGLIGWQCVFAWPSSVTVCGYLCRSVSAWGQHRFSKGVSIGLAQGGTGSARRQRRVKTVYGQNMVRAGPAQGGTQGWYRVHAGRSVSTWRHMEAHGRHTCDRGPSVTTCTACHVMPPRCRHRRCRGAWAAGSPPGGTAIVTATW